MDKTVEAMSASTKAMPCWCASRLALHEGFMANLRSNCR
jgi:hypothetical protein